MAGRTLTVYLAADTDRFRSGMNTAGRQAQGLRGRLSSLSSTMTGMLGPALAGGAVAAGAFAFKMGVEGVQAAIEEEKELAKLHQTVKTLGFEGATADIDAFVDAQARASTFSDSDLRPAFARLLTSIKDVGETQRMTQLAMDISVGTGKDLDAVVHALGKAYDGNTGALARLGVGLTKAQLKTMDLDQITDTLAGRFAGQSSAAAQTMSGKLGNLTEAFDELKESFGKGFLDGLDGAEAGAADLTETLYELQETAANVGTKMAELTVKAGGLVQPALDANEAYLQLMDSLSDNEFLRGALLVVNPIKAAYESLGAVIGEVLVLMGKARKLAEVGDGTITDLGSLTPRPVNMGGGRPQTSWQNLSEQAITGAVANALARGDARNGYVVGGVLR